MKIYTRTGDDGATGLFGGDRVDKDDARVEAYGTVDETNAALGVVRATSLSREMDALLERIQVDLFQIGAELACASGKTLRSPIVGNAEIEWLEHTIDEQERHLAPLKNFVLPTGMAGAAALHLARTVCRRAERRVVSAKRDTEVRDVVLIYLNRLSDLLFVLARRCNQLASVSDTPWAPRERNR